MRILITITPQMYRQALALSIRSRRPGYEVMVVSPEAAAVEIAAFEPHLLLHNDNDELGSEVVAGVPCRVTVLYTDSMDARITMRGQVREARDITTEELLRVLDSISGITG
jgi:hypothetical protein